MRRAQDRAAGLPITKKEKLRVAMLGLLKIALGDATPKDTAERTLNILGVKPKTKEEVKAEEITNG